MVSLRVSPPTRTRLAETGLEAPRSWIQARSRCGGLRVHYIPAGMRTGNDAVPGPGSSMRRAVAGRGYLLPCRAHLVLFPVLPGPFSWILVVDAGWDPGDVVALSAGGGRAHRARVAGGVGFEEGEGRAGWGGVVGPVRWVRSGVSE